MFQLFDNLRIKVYLPIFILVLGMDRISGLVSGIRRNPAIFQLSGIRPDTGYQKTGYPVFEYPAGYPANRILMKTFSLTLRFEMLYFLE